jgi:tetratricopeptide (TPR) repeat protein
VEADLGTARRAALHGSIGRALEGLFPMLTQEAGGSEQLDQLAYHFARSELADKAVQYLEQAGDVARARYAYAVAEGYYRELITQLGRMPSAPARIRVRMKLGEVLTRAGRYDEALGILEQAAELAAATGDRALEAQAVAQVGDVHFRRARPKEEIERIRRLLEAQADEPPLAELHLTLAQLFYESGEYREMLAAAERASELARDRGDERAHREAEFQRGLALQTLGSTKALSVLEEVARLAEAVGDLLLLTRALHFLGYMYFMRGDFARHRAIEERALTTGEQVGDPDEIGGRLQQLGVHYWVKLQISSGPS